MNPTKVVLFCVVVALVTAIEKGFIESDYTCDAPGPNISNEAETIYHPIGGCVSDCTGVADGDYLSCLGCDVFATCSNQLLIDNRACPSSLLWNDELKRCDYAYTTGACNVNKTVIGEYGSFHMDLRTGDIGQSYIDQGDMWKIGSYGQISDSPVLDGSCSTQIKYDFHPPPCIKKMQISFEAEIESHQYFGFVHGVDVSNIETIRSWVLSDGTAKNIAVATNEHVLTVFDGELGLNACLRVQSDLFEMNGDRINGTVDTSMEVEHRNRLFTDMGSDPYIFVLNIRLGIPIIHEYSHICSFTVNWQC